MHKSVAISHPLSPRPPRVLVVGDEGGHVRAAVDEALPEVATVGVATVFDAVAELQAREYGAVLVNVAPLEHRPEAAVRALREQITAGATTASRPARLVVFGEIAQEPQSRQAVELGGDEYILLPARADELRQALAARPSPAAADIVPTGGMPLLPDNVPLVTIVLDALLDQAGGSMARSVERINEHLPRPVRLELVDAPADGADAVSVPIAGQHLLLHVPSSADAADRDVALHELSALAAELAKLAELDARHAQLQKLALTDELTGCYNRRYFRHYLDKLLVTARRERFPVTLLLFDIDDFKHYNDRHGHGVGDAILRQTAELIRRCVRDHDLVARIGGDEFAVVFWEKDAPRVPHDPASAPRGRFPQGPLAIAARFRRLLAEPDFFALGSTGRGSLTISGGMAVFPFDAQSGDELIEAADKALLFGSKRGGKNGITLVGESAMERTGDPAGAGPAVA